jgi:3-oxoadipate enol-lactonase
VSFRAGRGRMGLAGDSGRGEPWSASSGGAVRRRPGAGSSSLGSSTVIAVRRVVLLHSALGDSRLWRDQVEALSRRFEVVAPDLPGFGEEAVPEEPFSFVDRVAGLLPAALVGNSFGGAVALRTAMARPDDVDRLVLVASSVPGWRFGDEMQAYFAAEEAALEAGDLEWATELNLEFWVAPEQHDLVRPLQRRAFELQTEHDTPEVLWPEESPLSSVLVPTLVIVGERDRADFRAIARHLAEQIPDARLVEVPDAGHLVGVDQPEALNGLLLEFLGDDG